MSGTVSIACCWSASRAETRRSVYEMLNVELVVSGSL
jgi:hypothetical protein